MLYFPYIFILLFPIYGYLNKNQKLIKPNHIFLLYFLFAALRGNGNGDYTNYINGVSGIQTFSDVINPGYYPFEIGFRIVAYINNLLNLDPQFTIVILNFTSLIIVKYIIAKYSKNQWLSWLLYFPFLLLFDMHHMRSAVAMNIILLMFHFWTIEKRYIIAIIVGLSASAFHKSSLIIFAFLILYYVVTYVSDKNNNKTIQRHKVARLFLVLVVLIRFIAPPKAAVIKLNQIFPGNSLLSKAASYLSNERWSYPFKLYDPRVFLLLMVYMTGEYVIDKENKLERNYLIIFSMSIATLIFLSESTILTMRMYNYFNLFIILLVPIIIYSDKFKQFNLKLTNKFKVLSKIRMMPLELFFIVCYVVYSLAIIYIQVPYFFFF